MGRPFELLNPISTPGWNDLLRAAPGYTIFHSSEWAEVLQASYGYQPRYFTSSGNGRLEALVAMMEIDSPWTGKRGVSLPFSDYCPPLVSNGVDPQELLEAVARHARETHWNYFEIRGPLRANWEAVPSCRYYRHTLELRRQPEELLGSFSSNTERNIRKAVREGVEVRTAQVADAVRDFYRLFCMTRKRQGLPPPPYSFFKNLHQRLIAKDHGLIALAQYRGRIVAGAVFFHMGEKALYKYGASDMHFKRLRANHLVMWEAIRFYAANGYQSLCFGRTEPADEGLRRFKIGWGTREESLEYYRYDVSQERFVTVRSNATGVHNAVFARMPIGLLRLTGAVLYRHMG